MMQFLLDEREEHVIKQYLESSAKNETISLNSYLRNNLAVYCFSNWYCTLCWRKETFAARKEMVGVFIGYTTPQVSKYRVFADLCFLVSGLFSRSAFWLNFGIFYVRFHLIGICIILEVRKFNWKSERDHDGSWNWYYKKICMFGLSQHDQQWEKWCPEML